MGRGILFVFSGPSGTGKGTVLKEVFKTVENLFYSVSATTRAPRAGERDGESYYFVDDRRFDEMIANGELLEHVGKFGNRYGTPKKYVGEMLDEGKDVILEIETTGADSVRRFAPEAVSIFVAPPGLTELWKRLTRRDADENSCKLRFETCRDEIKEVYKYDYVVINDDVGKCARQVADIIEAERRRVRRNGAVIEKILNN